MNGDLIPDITIEGEIACTVETGTTCVKKDTPYCLSIVVSKQLNVC